MTMNDKASRLLAGETIVSREPGNSMTPKIQSRQPVRLAPCFWHQAEKGDIVYKSERESPRLQPWDESEPHEGRSNPFRCCIMSVASLDNSGVPLVAWSHEVSLGTRRPPFGAAAPTQKEMCRTGALMPRLGNGLAAPAASRPKNPTISIVGVRQCRVRISFYTHLVLATNDQQGVLIGNNHGRTNGWTKNVFGRVVEVLPMDWKEPKTEDKAP